MVVMAGWEEGRYVAGGAVNCGLFLSVWTIWKRHRMLEHTESDELKKRCFASWMWCDVTLSTRRSKDFPSIELDPEVPNKFNNIGVEMWSCILKYKVCREGTWIIDGARPTNKHDAGTFGDRWRHKVRHFPLGCRFSSLPALPGVAEGRSPLLAAVRRTMCSAAPLWLLLSHLHPLIAVSKHKPRNRSITSRHSPIKLEHRVKMMKDL